MMFATRVGVQFSALSEEIKNSRGRTLVSLQMWASTVWWSQGPGDPSCPKFGWTTTQSVLALSGALSHSDAWAQQCFHGEHSRDLFMGVPSRELCLGRSSVLWTSHNRADLLWPVIAGYWLHLKNIMCLPLLQ